jgi:hypothetical protein
METVGPWQKRPAARSRACAEATDENYYGTELTPAQPRIIDIPLPNRPPPSSIDITMSSVNSIVESLKVDGYVIVDTLIPEPLLEPLREAAARAVARARDETEKGWPHVYVHMILENSSF